MKLRPDTAAHIFQTSIAACDWKQAQAALSLLLERTPEQPSLLYNLALVLRRQNKNAEALDALDKALKLAPHQGAAYERAATLMDMGNLAQSLKSFKKYQRQFAEDPDALLNMGRICLALDAPVEAKAYFENRLRLMPDDTEAKVGLGEALTRMGEASGVTALQEIYRSSPQRRPHLLKIMTQTPTGRLPLRLSKLLQKEL